MLFGIFTQSIHYHDLILEYLHHSKKKPHTHQELFPISFPHTQSQTTTNLLSVSKDLDLLYKGNHIICRPVSFTQYNVFNVCPCCSMYQSLIPFYCRIIFHCMNIMLSFIHSSVSIDGLLLLFIYCETVVHKFLSIFISLGYTHRHRTAGSYGSSV